DGTGRLLVIEVTSVSVPENHTQQASDSTVFFFLLSLCRLPLIGCRRLFAGQGLRVAPEGAGLAAAGVQRTERGRLGSGDKDLVARLRTVRRGQHPRLGI